MAIDFGHIYIGIGVLVSYYLHWLFPVHPFKDLDPVGAQFL